MDNQIEYWVTESLENLDTAKVLFNNKKYLEATFFCHLSVEKMLKAFYVLRKKEVPPKIHNLLLLAERSNLTNELNQRQLDFLAILNPYHLEGRYPTNREILYKTTSLDKFSKIIEQTEEEISWYEQKLRSIK